LPASSRIVVALLVLVVLATLAACEDTYNYGSVSFVDPQHGWVTGWDQETTQTVVSSTLDRGATWQQVGSRGARAHIVGWAELSTPTTGVWCVDVDKLLFTTTGGRPWQLATVKGMRGGYFAAASFASANVGWAAGVHGQAKAGGSIAKTTDGGVTWVAQVSGVSAWLHGVCFTGVDSGFVIGGDGVILHTLDGGTQWTRQSAETTATLNAVDFVSSDEGWVVGEEGWATGQPGTLLHTIDGGMTWK
jgi:photosystem II stability/assembly factor-like uncharacterized protein